MNRDCSCYRQSHCCGVGEFSSIGVVSQASSSHVQLDWLKFSCHFLLDDASSICRITKCWRWSFRQCCLALFDSFSGDVKGSSEFQESLESDIQQQETKKLH